jgi:outer membrane protein
MKQFCTFVFILLSIQFSANAQKFGYIDSEYVLSKMPEYASAQKQLDDLAADWRKEVQNLRIEVQGLYDALQAEEVLLTKEMKDERLASIKFKEQEVENFQSSIFGPNGTFFVRQQELTRPIHDKVYEAIETVCRKQRLDFLFDKSGEMVMLFTNPRHDYTDFVLEELGLNNPNNPGK